ncbi:MAG: peptidoglycan-binding protein [Clostridia bacterium]|nr:peptidoglycan-binding protein [Clostridia bacterium]
MKRYLSLLLALMLLSSAVSAMAYGSSEPYDMGVPRLNGKVYPKESMNMVVFWVQTQLKATGEYYQGDIWDVTGSLGSHTVDEIKRFMKSRGYRSHNGQVDQKVIDELVEYFGGNTIPVYVGGFYNEMSSIMTGGSAGSMQKIYSNLRDMIPHVTTGARWVQVCLSKLGYYNSSIDGKYGEGTERAVKAFQRDYGFEERDYITLGVARAMLEACYYGGYSLQNLP